ncbi:hypothetical protein IAQ61_008165, partial [Plenodomus lingam]|uniref:uncharacterized protein n=1 Tax=Leptosphaeria maculans TaxID=5022 RepID=UPI003330DB76
YAISPLLPRLLAPCRDLDTAVRELGWLRGYVRGRVGPEGKRGQAVALLLKRLVKERARGVPLQYLLGTEFFGELEIACARGVLIPRPETAASTSHLAHLLLHTTQPLPRELRLLDLCTGSACIPLLFQHELGKSRQDVHVRALGVDICPRALRLARWNLRRVRGRAGGFAGRGRIELVRADVLGCSSGNGGRVSRRGSTSSVGGEDADVVPVLALPLAMESTSQPLTWDIVISNPPYISPRHFWSTTMKAVRNWEPRIALVPSASGNHFSPSSSPSSSSSPRHFPRVASSKNVDKHDHGNKGTNEKILSGSNDDDDARADSFYPYLITHARRLQAKILLLEVADLAQALRVARLATQLGGFEGVEIWRDEPGSGDNGDAGADTKESTEGVGTEEHGYKFFGRGGARSVVCWRGVGGAWLGKREMGG